MSTLLLPCCYLAPASHYSSLWHAGVSLIEVCDHYRRQTLRNLCMRDSPQGSIPLSIPVVKPMGRLSCRLAGLPEYIQ